MAIWGFGFNDGKHSATPEIAQSIVDWFHRGTAPQYRAAFIGGVPSGWRSLSKDAMTDSAWNAAYDSIATADNWLTSTLGPDNARTQTAGHGYQPVIFPGFSWHNLKSTDPQNAIPRRKYAPD